MVVMATTTHKYSTRQLAPLHAALMDLIKCDPDMLLQVSDEFDESADEQDDRTTRNYYSRVARALEFLAKASENRPSRRN